MKLNKKAVGLKEIVMLIIGLAFLVIMVSFFYGDQVRDTIEGSLADIFDVDISEDQRAQHQKRAESFSNYQSFIDDISLIDNSSNKEVCFGVLDVLPSALFNDYRINIGLSQEGYMQIQLFEMYVDENQQGEDLTRLRPLTTLETFENLKPCIIQGETNVENFYQSSILRIRGLFQKTENIKTQIQGITFKEFDKINVLENGEENTYDFHQNEKNKNIYVLKSGEDLCFIPTDNRLLNDRNCLAPSAPWSSFRFFAISELAYNCLDGSANGNLRKNLINHEGALCNSAFKSKLEGEE